MSISLGQLATLIVDEKNLASYPAQAGKSGKFLTTDGTTTSWADGVGGGGGTNVDGFVSGVSHVDLAQSSQFTFSLHNASNSTVTLPKIFVSSVDFSNGNLSLSQANASTQSTRILPVYSGQTGKFLTTDGTNLSWADAGGGGGGGTNVDGFVSGVSHVDLAQSSQFTFSLHNASNSTVTLPKIFVSSLDFSNGNLSLSQANASTQSTRILPVYSGQTGKFLTTDGTNLSWADAGGGGGGGTNVDGFVSGVSHVDLAQSSQFTFSLHNASNSTVTLPKIFVSSVDFSNGNLTISQANASTQSKRILPVYSGQSGKFLTTDGTNLSWADAGGGGGGTNVSCANQKLLTVTSEGVIDLPNIKIGSSTGGTTSNTFIGEFTGPDGNASKSTCFGVYAGAQAGILDESTHVGWKAGYLATDSRIVTCIGAQAGAYRQGDYTTCVGRKAGCLTNSTDGAASANASHNTYIGNEAGEGHTTGNYSIMIGSGTTAVTANKKLLIGYNGNNIIDGTMEGGAAWSNLTINAQCDINGKLKLLKTTDVLEFGDGTQLSSFPSQTSNSGKFLTTDGTNLSWGDGGTNVDGFLSGVSLNTSVSSASILTFTRENDSNITISIPTHNINTGLTTFSNGTLTLSQQNNPNKTLNILPSYTSNSGKFLTTDGNNLSWAAAGGGVSCANQKLLTVTSEGVIDLPNIKIGSSTGSSTSNTFIGEYTGPDGNASNSTCFGVYAGAQAGILDESTHIGSKAGYLATDSRQATTIGAQAGAYRQGDYTTCIGRKAGCLNNSTEGAASSGSSYNTYIGNEAGEGHTTGSYSIMIGNGTTAVTANKKLLIGYNGNNIIDGTMEGGAAWSNLTINAQCDINGKLKLLKTTDVLEFGDGTQLSSFPSQTSNTGKFLTTDGSDLSWGDGPNVDGFLSGVSLNTSMSSASVLTFTRENDSNITFNIPTHNINSGSTTFSNGTLSLSQQNNPNTIINILPTYNSNSGKFLTTDGTNLSWAEAGGQDISCANQRLLTVSSEGVIDLPNIKIGSSTGGTTTNTFIGEYTGPDGNASNSTCFGVYAGAQAGILDESTHVGCKAGYLATTSRQATCIGAEAGAYRQGDYTTCIGRKAGCLSNTTDGAASSGSVHNTYIGNEAGEGHKTGNYNIMIGSKVTAEPAYNKLLIGYNNNHIIDGTIDAPAFSTLTFNALCNVNGKLKLVKATDVLEFGDGTQLSSFPSQSSNSGKVLTTDGTNLSWGEGGNSIPHSQNSNKTSLYVGDLSNDSSTNPYNNYTTAVGHRAHANVSSGGQWNANFGAHAGQFYNGQHNVFVGYSSGGGGSSSSGGSKSGDHNVMVGHQAGQSSGGHRNIFIGSGVTDGSGDDRFKMGYSTNLLFDGKLPTGSTEGELLINATTLKVNSGIKTEADLASLEVGQLYVDTSAGNVLKVKMA